MNPQCPCGSGLRPLRCCAWRVQDRPGTEAKRHLLPLVDQAAEAIATGDIARRNASALRCWNSPPDCIPALARLHDIRQRQKRPEAAEALLRRIVALDPNNLAATQELALALFARGSLGEAELHARKRHPPRARKPAGPQSDGHDPDRDQPAAGGRISLPGASSRSPARRAIPSCSPPRLEPQEPGPDGRGPRPLRESLAAARASATR